MMKQTLSYGLRIVVSIAILGFLFTRINIQDLSNHIQSMDLRFLLAAIICFILYICSWALRWQLFIVDTGVKVNYFHTLRTLLIGLAVSLFLPSAIGADIGRAYDLSRTEAKKIAILSTVVMDRIVGLIALVGMSVVAILIAGYQYLTQDIFIAVLIFAILLVIGWLVFFNILFMRRFRPFFESIPILNRLTRKVHEFYMTLYYLQRNRQLLSRAVLISVLTVFLEILAVIMLSYGIGDRIDPVFFFLFMPVIWVVLIIPIAIGGLGLREAVFVFFFTQVGMSATHAITVSLLYYSLYAVTGILSGSIPVLHSFSVKLLQAVK